MSEPTLIQGGMGAAVSNWRLARAVSTAGQLGVVSGTALDTIFARRLQNGDLDMLRALEQFPLKEMAQRVKDRYFISGGKKIEEPYRRVPMHSAKTALPVVELTIVANFAEVYLAKEGHEGLVGVNYLEKIQTPTLPSLYGAILAGVDYVLMGAGIPRAIPGILALLCQHKKASLKLYVDGATSEEVFETTFDPSQFAPMQMPPLKNPKFLAIVSSAVLALTLARKSSGAVSGFVIEGPTAGGHNAPPRGELTLNENGEPIYGSRDEVNLKEIEKLGLPFWLAGFYGTPEKFKQALEQGACGVQVGTAFAYCDESGLTDEIKAKVLDKVRNGSVRIFTDPLASSSGYPFKVVQLEGSLSEEEVYQDRPRVCDLGYLRSAYKKEDGSLGFRCPGEPVDEYVRKGGDLKDTIGRKCLCNALLANVGMPTVQPNGYVEKTLVTSGDALSEIGGFLKEGATSYSARDVIDQILGRASI
ncbi:nitronate monooxygenase [soil metagenome]